MDFRERVGTGQSFAPTGAELPEVEADFREDEFCQALRRITTRAEAEKSSERRAAVEPGDRVKIVKAQPFPDGSVRLQVEDLDQNLLGWISCYDSKGDPLLENVDTDTIKMVTSSDSPQGGEPSADEVASTAARFALKKSKQQERWNRVRGTMNSLSAFRSQVALASENKPKTDASPLVALSPPRTGPPPKELRDAVRHGAIDVVRRCVQNGDYANSISNQKLGSTLLYSAAQNGHLEIADHLIAQGADVNIRTKKGATALYTAAFNGDANMVEKLLSCGASPHEKKDDGWTALRAAQHRGNSDVVDVLKRWETNGSQAVPEQQSPLSHSPTLTNAYASPDRSASSLAPSPDGHNPQTFSQSPKPMSPQEQRVSYTQEQEQDHGLCSTDDLQLGTESAILGSETGWPLGTSMERPISEDTLRIAQLAEMRAHMEAAAAISAQLTSGSTFAVEAPWTGDSVHRSQSPVDRQMQDPGGTQACRTPSMPARRPRHVQDVSSQDIRVGASTVTRSTDHIARSVMPVDLSTSAPVQNSVGPAQADQIVSIANIRSWELPPRPGARHSPLPAVREPGKVWDKDYEDTIAEKRVPGRLVESSSMLGDELKVWDSDDSRREIAKKRYEAKEAESCVNDFVADLFSEAVASTPLSVTRPIEKYPSLRCFCNNCGGASDTSKLPTEDLVLVNPAEQCGCRATISIRNHLCGVFDGRPKVDDAIHKDGFLSHFVFTASAPLETPPLPVSQLSKRPDLPRKARRSKLAADAETACNDISANARWDDPHGDSLVLGHIGTPSTYKYYKRNNKRDQTMECMDLHGKHHLMLNRLRAERGETMHPMLVMDEHGPETESQRVLRQEAEAAEKQRVEAERLVREAEEQKYAEQTAAAKAEEAAAALRATEAEAARKVADAEAVVAEATLQAARQRRNLEATRSKMVQAEAEEQKSREMKDQAEVNHSHAERAVTQARSADQRAKNELSDLSRKRVARTPGSRPHGTLSTRLSPQDLDNPEKIVPYLDAHVRQLKDWQGEIKGDTDSAVSYSATLPLQSLSPKGVADVIKRRVESSFSRHAKLGPPYEALHTESASASAVANPRQIVVTVEVPPNADIERAIFSGTDGLRILRVEDKLPGSETLPEGTPPSMPSPILCSDTTSQPPTSPPTNVTDDATDDINQSNDRSQGGVSYYTQSTPLRPGRDPPVVSPNMALNSYQRRCAHPISMMQLR